MANFGTFSHFARCNFKTMQGIFTKPSFFYTSWRVVVNQYGHQGERSKVKVTEVKIANFVIFSHFARCNFKTMQGIFPKSSLFYTSRELVVNQYGGQGERSKVKVTELKNCQFCHFFAFCAL